MSATVLAGCFLACVLVVLLVVLVVQDVCTRSISALVCYAFVGVCALFRACVSGGAELFAGVFWALLVCGLCWISNLAARYRVRARVGCNAPTHADAVALSAIGNGDVWCLVGMSLAGGAVAPLALLATFGTASIVSLAGVFARKLHLTDGIPFLPFLIPGTMVALFGVA